VTEKNGNPKVACVRVKQSCVGNFDWAFAVTGKEKDSKKREIKVGAVSGTFSRAVEA
jgi:hypothetical protein